LYLFFFSTATDKPAAPRELRAVDRSKDSISLTWRSPETDGGAPILSYIIERREGTRATWTKIGETSSETHKFKATRLTEGTDYQFRVAAENTIGLGPYVTLDQSVKASLPFGERFEFCEDDCEI
jgi:hypothetical protein